MKRFFRAVIALSALLNLFAVVLGYAGPLAHAFDMLAHFRLHLLWAGAIVAVCAILARDGKSLWRATVAATIALAGLTPLWEVQSPTGEGRRLVVMTANLFQDNEETDAMLRMLGAADADILVTNETTKAVQTGARPLTGLYPFRLSLSTHGQILRTVIWSKFPMRNGALLLEDQVEPTGAHGWVRIAPGVEISVMGLHLAHAYPGNQARQIAALEGIVATLPEPRIVLGDFNAAPWSHALARVEALTGTRRIPGYRVTWRGSYSTPLGHLPAPLGHAIDHVLVTPGIGVEAVETIPIPGSDHRAVRAVLRIPDP